MMRTYKSSSFNAPIETVQLDEVQVERLDLGKHGVEGGPIQNTCQQRVFTLQLRHHRLKRRLGGRAKVAGDPNRVQTRSLLHLSNGQDSRGESASPGSSERSVSWLPRHGGAYHFTRRVWSAGPDSSGLIMTDSPGTRANLCIRRCRRWPQQSLGVGKIGNPGGEPVRQLRMRRA